MTRAVEPRQVEEALAQAGLTPLPGLMSKSGSQVFRVRGGSIIRGLRSELRVIATAEGDECMGAQAMRALLSHELELGDVSPALVVLERAVDLGVQQWATVEWSYFARAIKQPGRLRQLLVERLPLATLSPYQSDAPTQPDMFFGRVEDRKDLCGVARNYIVIGPRRGGKSSLAAWVRRELRSNPDLRIALGAKGEGRYLHSCALVDMGRPDSISKIWQLVLRDMGLEARDLAGGMRLKVTFQRGSPIDARTDYELVESLMRHKYSHALLLLDEVDSILAEDEANDWKFFNSLRTLMSETSVRVALFGYERLWRATLSEEFPLFGRSATVKRLANLGHNEVGHLIGRPMSELGVIIEDPQQTTTLIYGATGGRPSLVQDICNELLEELDRRHARTLTLHDVERVLDTLEPAGRLYRTFRALHEPLPQMIAFLGAEDGEVNVSSMSSRLERQWHLKVTDRDVLDACDYLFLHGVLQQVSAGSEYVYANDLLHSKILNEMQESDGVAIIRRLARTIAGSQ